MPSPLPDSAALHLDLDDRPVCGQDLLFLQQWYELSRLDMCYLLGLSDLKWCAYTHPDRIREPLGDPAVALLVWLLVRYPETFFLPAFPSPREVYPLYDRLAARADAPLYLGKTAFGLLLGREIGSATRWLAPAGSPAIAPTVARLLFVFQNRLRTCGVVGLEEWVADARREAEARGLDLRGKMTSWFRMDVRPPKRSRRPRTRKARTARAADAPTAPRAPADPAPADPADPAD
jgi:hypothetical protein